MTLKSNLSYIHPSYILTTISVYRWSTEWVVTNCTVGSNEDKKITKLEQIWNAKKNI